MPDFYSPVAAAYHFNTLAPLEVVLHNCGMADSATIEQSGAKERDWPAIRFEYESTAITHRDLAKKHGIPYSTLGRRAMREKWSQRKRLVESAARKVESQITERIEEQVRNELAPWIEAKRTEITKRGVNVSERGLSRVEEGLDAVESGDSKSVSEIARAAETFLRMARVSLGMSDGSSVGGALNLQILTNQAAVQINPPAS